MSGADFSCIDYAKLAMLHELGLDNQRVIISTSTNSDSDYHANRGEL